MKLLNLVNLTLLITSTCLANQNITSNERLADSQTIQAKNASGEMQTTVVDDSGNLKAVDTQSLKSQPPAINNQDAALPANTNINTIDQTKTR